jgi:hypothetical protein
MVERMVFHGHGRTMSDDQVVRLLEEHGDTEAVGYTRSQAAFVGWVVLFTFLGGTYLVSLLSWFFNWTLRH